MEVNEEVAEAESPADLSGISEANKTVLKSYVEKVRYLGSEIQTHATYHLEITCPSGVQGVPRGEGEGRQGAGGQDEVLQHHPGQDRREGDRLRGGLTRETPYSAVPILPMWFPDSV